jgi:hypothetical protein
MQILFFYEQDRILSACYTKLQIFFNIVINRFSTDF